MYRCNSDDDELPTVMATPRSLAAGGHGAAPATMPMLAVPRASTIPRDIAEYANAFAQAEELAQAAAHVHAARFATPPPPAPTPRTLPVPHAAMAHAPHPVGPRTNALVMRASQPRSQAFVDTVRRRHRQTVHIPGRTRSTPWSSIALVTFVGVVATLSAMAAFIQFKDTSTSERSDRGAAITARR